VQRFVSLKSYTGSPVFSSLRLFQAMLDRLATALRIVHVGNRKAGCPKDFLVARDTHQIGNYASHPSPSVAHFAPPMVEITMVWPA
jgi:hypothetical protein